MKKQPKIRSFWPVHVNCDCCSYDWARLRPPPSGGFMRCIYCKKSLGDMQVDYYPKVRAKTDEEAWDLAIAAKKALNQKDWKVL